MERCVRFKDFIKAGFLVFLCFSAFGKPLSLQGAMQTYEWGGFDYLPSFVGLANPTKTPHAELWFGTHLRGPTTARDFQGKGEMPLAKVLPEGLTFLLKVLDARQMLSIQVHPNKKQAEEGYARENSAGIDVTAPNRNYKDRNHKPEGHIALTKFWLLHGFMPLEDIAKVLKRTEFEALMPDFDAKMQTLKPEVLMHSLYKKVMVDMKQDQVDAVLGQLIRNLNGKELSKSSPDYWALRAAKMKPAHGEYDRGIFSIYFMNLVQLEPGEGTVQEAGVPHAYLEGTTVEIMANSDNVLRAGLTPKHVDINELMAVISFSTGKPQIFRDSVATQDFSLVKEKMPKEVGASQVSRILLPVLEKGHHATVVLDDSRHELELGRAVYLPADDTLSIEGDGMLFVASPSPH